MVCVYVHVHFHVHGDADMICRDLIIGTTTAIVLITLFIKGGLMNDAIKILGVETNVDAAAFVSEVMQYSRSELVIRLD
jgi:hypothetical protein